MIRSLAWRRASLATMTTLISMACAELVARHIDGYGLWTLRLVRVHAAAAAVDDGAASRVLDMPVASGVQRAWFDDEPEHASGGSQSPDADLLARTAAYPDRVPAGTYQWNIEYLRQSACEQGTPRHTEVVSNIFPVENLFVFDPPGGSPYPRFRFLPNARYPSGLITNSFGWRGADVALEKPPRTIRLAFVGASTTVAPHQYRNAYPDYIGRWLSRWAASLGMDVRFEAINAGREGIDSSSIAAIVRDELAPLEPDVVVYYEGANQFGPSDFVVWPGGTVTPRPASHAWPLASTSALVARAKTLTDPFIVRRDEPHKPRLPIAWPADLDERDPRLDHSRLTLELPTVMRDLDTMRAALADAGGQLAISSFVWCVKDGMQLDPARDAGVYRYLNEMFWPFSYAYMRRLADFQNRVLQKYADVHRLHFVDVARWYPIDPSLFIDGVHMTPNGTKLMAWIAFQHLVSILSHAIADGSLPQPQRRHWAAHPSFAEQPRRLTAVGAIRSACPSAD